MNTKKAYDLAIALMEANGLWSWSFKFDRAISRFGCCQSSRKLITVSKRLVELNDESQVKDTILHEIAHAIVGGHEGHNDKWRDVAKLIGCSGERCYSSSNVIVPKGNYVLRCPNCKRESYYYRRPRNSRACGRCCKEFNNGYYDSRFILECSKI